MSKPLSQDEIDILLEVRSQLDESEGSYDLDSLSSIMEFDAEKRVMPYNFKRPRLFSQDQMRLLSHVHESFARDLAVYLSAQLRTIVDISLTAMDQVLYAEYVMSSAPPSALYVVNVEGQDNQMVFELDPRLVIFTIEKLFGGPGEFLRRPREISQIERRIMSKVMGRAFQELEKAWEQIFPLTLEEDSFESNAEFVQIIPGVEPALVGTFEVTVYDQHSFLNICYPYILLERLLGRKGIKQWLSTTTSEVEEPVRIAYERNLKAMGVELGAKLGQTRLSINDLTNLQVGDVIPLHQKVSEPINVMIGNTAMFKAAPGNAGKRRAFRILEVLQPEIGPLDIIQSHQEAQAAARDQALQTP